MIVGVPKEIKTAENRVAMTPAGVRAFVGAGHKVIVETNAGLGSGIANRLFTEAGAVIIDSADEVWKQAEMIVKVKEPIEPEYPRMREGQILFTYLHLAAIEKLTHEMMRSGIVGIAYETIQLPDRSLPLLAPMSEVAGKLSVQFGAWALEHRNGGMGILLSGASGATPAKVCIVGAGISGTYAAHIAVGMGADVTLLDIDLKRLEFVYHAFHGQVRCVVSHAASIADEIVKSDLVIGAVLIPGAAAPKLITEDMVREMKTGSVIVDISVDQGGCCETTKATTHIEPTYKVHDVTHYCVANMPGCVPMTSTYSLTNATFKYGLDIANKGWEKALEEDRALQLGLNIWNGKVTCKGVADAFGMDCSEY